MQSQPQDYLPGWRKTFRKDLRSPIFHLTAEGPFEQQTAWNGLTRKFEEGRKPKVFFRMRLRVSG